MNLYKDHVVLFNQDSLGNIPEEFENEIYYSDGFETEAFYSHNYFSNYSVKFVLEGHEEYIVNGKKKMIGKNQLLIVNDESEVTNLSSNGSAFSVFLNKDVLEDSFHSISNSLESLLDDYNASRRAIIFFDEPLMIEKSKFHYLRTHVHNNPELMIPIDYYYEIAEFLISTQKGINRMIDQIGNVKFSTRKELFRRINVAKNYLDDTINKNFDLNELSKISCVSKYQLVRNFKEVYGITPNRYFIMKKLLKAKELITGCNLPLYEISNCLGYKSIYAFSKQFKLFFGYSPSFERGKTKQ